jgi:hypothetical protein
MMPIAIAQNEMIELSGEPLASRRPDLAALLGAFTAEWGNVESTLAFLFAVYVGINARVSMGILDRVMSTRNKLNIVKFAVENLEPDEPTRRELRVAMNRIIRLLDKRNAMIHGRWSVSDAYPMHLIWMRNTLDVPASYLGYDATDLTNETTSVAVARSDIQHLFLRKVHANQERPSSTGLTPG